MSIPSFFFFITPVIRLESCWSITVLIQRARQISQHAHFQMSKRYSKKDLRHSEDSNPDPSYWEVSLPATAPPSQGLELVVFFCVPVVKQGKTEFVLLLNKVEALHTVRCLSVTLKITSAALDSWIEPGLCPVCAVFRRSQVHDSVCTDYDVFLL